MGRYMVSPTTGQNRRLLGLNIDYIYGYFRVTQIHVPIGLVYIAVVLPAKKGRYYTRIFIYHLNSQ